MGETGRCILTEGPQDERWTGWTSQGLCEQRISSRRSGKASRQK